MTDDLSFNQLKDSISAHFGFEIVKVSSLSGYDNRNFKLTRKDGVLFVLKMHNPSVGISFLEAESKLLACLNEQLPGLFPRPITNRDGNYLFQFESHICRLYTWLDGRFLAEVNHNKTILSSFAGMLAKLNQQLFTYSDPVIEARHMDWDVQYFLDLKSRSKVIQDASIRKLVDHFLLQFREFIQPQIHTLRNSIIHNDANDWNVLVTSDRVSGLIDFGDVVFAPIIQEVAVALTYILMGKEEPLQWAGHFLMAYHKVLPLEEKEIDLLYYFIAARLSLSLIHSFDAIQDGKADEYILISQKGAIDLLKKWITISPDKAAAVFREALRFKIPAQTDYDQELAKRYAHIGKVQSVTYKQPIKMKRAAFQYMFDADGNTFLDAYNNIPHVGHQHPQVVEAAQRQMAMLNTNTRYLYDQLADYAEKLLSKFPKPLNKVFIVNSGSEASDLAIRIAQNFSGNSRVAVLEHGYHGNTRMGINISHYKFGGKGGSGPEDFITLLPIPDTFRGPKSNDDGTAGKAYAKEAIKVLENTNDQIAAFIAEPIVGCGGQVPLAKDYLKSLYPEIRKRGGLCISDEVQTGFGRMGSHFWGFEMQGVIPDVVVLGKPMGNGHPMGAVVTTDEIAEAFNNGMEFFSSFGGNPVSCAIGMAVLDVIVAESLQQNALKTGSYFMEELRKLQKDIPMIGDVRGSGLFIGVDLVIDPETRQPNTELAQTLKNKLRENFILVSTDGPYDNVIKMKPPLCFNKSNADQVIEKMRRFLY
ncbi:MAG: aminotransferase class III-fold pyridoxal phosphate-dependent enzyme [Bacteroidetes bacterium]|nr:aminotransferase class III-fold pyridoxal phosphate-dependent enzyme [Bacteroidota bacterium]